MEPLGLGSPSPATSGRARGFDVKDSRTHSLVYDVRSVGKNCSVKISIGTERSFFSLNSCALVWSLERGLGSGNVVIPLTVTKWGF